MVHRAAHQSEPTEKVENPAGYRDLVKRGGAEYDAFTVNMGAVCWPKILLRAKALAEERNGKVVPVADGGAIELVVGAEDSELEFIQPENILRAATVQVGEHGQRLQDSRCKTRSSSGPRRGLKLPNGN
ncbi:hypothetical protein BC826DRAFT_1187152, partial [Russula brevipes]